MAKLNPGRRLAYRALKSSLMGEPLERILGNGDCSPRDLGLAWHISYGVLRRKGQLDTILKSHVKGAWSKVKPDVQISLQIGLFECLFSRTPNRAAISQAVELVKTTKQRYASGLVNAVLRKAQQDELPAEISNVPEWMRPYFSGYESWLSEQPSVHVVTQSLMPPSIEGAVKVTDAIDGLYRVDQPVHDITNWSGFQDGEWWVMDPAAVRVVDMGWEELNCPSKFTALDVCSAPGGKTWRLISRGASVTATDISEARLSLLQKSAQRLNFTPTTFQWDWTSGVMAGLGKFDFVLVDAPCSGSGVIRRHPEIRWRRTPADIKANGILQRQILKNAAQCVSENGVLVYSVCSVFPEEGQEVVDRLDNWKVMSQATTLPSEINEDAFQIFVLRREE